MCKERLNAVWKANCAQLREFEEALSHAENEARTLQKGVKEKHAARLRQDQRPQWHPHQNRESRGRPSGRKDAGDGSGCTIKKPVV